MRVLPSWRGVAAVGGVAALFAATVAMAPGAAASGPLHSCPNKTFLIEVPTGYGTETEKLHERIKAISSQGVSCAAADKVIQQDLTSTTGKVGSYKCRAAKFKVPVGYFPIACTRPGAKVQYGRHGG
jgi:hypothetical protein